MRLWIDVREACRARKTGKGQWTLRCVTALLERADVRVTLLTDEDIPAAWKALPGFIDVRTLSSGMRWHLAAWKLLRKERKNVDAYLAPTSFIVPFLIGKTVPTICIVHDLIAFRNEPHDRKATMIERMTLPRALRMAKAVCSVSDATANALREKFGSHVRFVTVGAGPTIDPASPSFAEASTWTGGGNHILCIGTLCPRKNQLRLIKAFASLPSSVRGDTVLKLVGGRGWQDDDIVRAAKETDGVEWLGFQDDASCRELLRTCTAFALLSEEEGFGLPLLDAMTVGAPLLASDIPVFHEVAGDAAVYADPTDVKAIAEGITRVLTDDSSENRATGKARSTMFSWQKTAEAVLRSCAGAR